MTSFASQVYPVLGLCELALATETAPGNEVGPVCDFLVEAQGGLGQWWWFYSTRGRRVIEGYPVYSVHQDAMAPMALLELWEACRDARLSEAVARGLSWIDGNNELGVNMVDRTSGLVLRSIRRKPGYDRLWAGAKTAASVAGLSRQGVTARLIETNPTDRPYHFGWVLEAWCGREDVLNPKAATEASCAP